ncbi:DUF4160 domain-containing protein [Pararhodospirillum photometricum]|uniref:DUF4160 domain-containing protein n=1 Tax=Pararhodospirillum photometricum TaxID=1084 RepID=UPI0012FE9CAA
MRAFCPHSPVIKSGEGGWSNWGSSAAWPSRSSPGIIPPPHIHVIAAGEKALVCLETGAILAGDLSPATRRVVADWLTDQGAAALDTFNALTPKR